MGMLAVHANLNLENLCFFPNTFFAETSLVQRYLCAFDISISTVGGASLSHYCEIVRFKN